MSDSFDVYAFPASADTIDTLAEFNAASADAGNIYRAERRAGAVVFVHADDPERPPAYTVSGDNEKRAIELFTAFVAGWRARADDPLLARAIEHREAISFARAYGIRPKLRVV